MNLIKNILLFSFSALLLISCKREITPASPVSAFTVKADSLSTLSDTAYYPLGVSTGFNFSGNPFTITFFSGEVGHRYDYRNRTSVLGTSKFIFTNAINLGTQAN